LDDQIGVQIVKPNACGTESGVAGQIFVDHPRLTSAAEEWSPATKGMLWRPAVPGDGLGLLFTNPVGDE
jgi:hypothetical protein